MLLIQDGRGFKTDRSSVTKIRNKINPKNKSSVWDGERFEKEKIFINTKIKTCSRFSLFIESFPRSTEDQAT